MKRAAIIVAGLAVLVIGAALWLSAMPSDRSGTIPPARVESMPASEAKRDAPGPQLHLLEWPATKPRPMSSVLPDAGATAVVAAAPAEPEQREQHEDGPIDRREHQGPRAAAEHEALKYAFQTIDEDVSECLAQWAKLDSRAPPQVMLAFEIDRDGLQKSWLDQEGEVPLGIESCIAGAAYGLDWSHIVDQPAKLTMKFGTPRDGGQ